MIEFTIGDLLDGKQQDPDDAVVYVVRDRGTVFYVGASRGVTARLWNHLGIRHRLGNSELGALVRVNEPDSHAWTVELYESAEFGTDHVKDAELRAIALLKPWLNRQHGYGPVDLPLGYKTRSLRRFRDPASKTVDLPL